MTITLKDLEIRYAGIMKKNPGLPRCSYPWCPNPIDWTEGMGWDTSCAYHRLLFDYWLYEVYGNDAAFLSSQQRRERFREWVRDIGSKNADLFVLEMANDAINWRT